MKIAPDTHMGLVELTVSDLDRSLAYWQDAVGLRVLSRENGTAELGADTPLIRFVFGPGSANGSTFVDGGHDLHMVRNNSATVTADVYVVSFVPAGFGRRIDEPNPNPGICPS